MTKHPVMGHRTVLSAAFVAALALSGNAVAGETSTAPKASADKPSDPCRTKIGRERPAGCAPWSARKRAEPPARVRTATKNAEPRMPEIVIPRDTRRQLEDRRREMLIAELSQLEHLLAKTRPKSPDRAMLIRRVAEGYAELAALAQREATLAEIKREKAKRELEKPATAPAKKSTKRRKAPQAPASPYPKRL